MKIIFLLPSLRVNGVPVLFELADRLLERNHDVRITSLDELVSPIYPLKIQPQKIQDSLKFFEKADAIIAYHPSCAFYINDLDVQAKKFYFLTDDIKKFYSRKTIKANFPKLDKDRIEVEHEAQQKYLEASYQLPFTFLVTNESLFTIGFQKKSIIIPIGVNHKLFYPELAVPKNDIPRILVEGNLFPWKGVESINRALSDLRGFELWTMSNTKFTIKSDKHWINPTIGGTRKILSSCDILIRAYYEDGTAELQAQAMACGCAVITRETAGAKMFCKHEENSLVFQTGRNPKDDASKIKSCIEKLMKNKTLREKIIRGGLETAKELDWENSVNKLESVLK